MTVSPRHQPHQSMSPRRAEVRSPAGAGVAPGGGEALGLIATWLGPPNATSAAAPLKGGLGAELTAEVQAAALAEATRAQYRLHALAWVEWCTARGVPPLAAPAQAVAEHLCQYAVLLDDDGHPIRDEAGMLQPAVAPKTVAQRLCAVGKLYELAGAPAPGASDPVRRVMKGLRRMFRRASRGRAAADWRVLRLLVQAAREPGPDLLRRRVAVLLQLRADATPGQVSRLRWEDVRIYDHRVVLTLPDGRRRGAGGRTATVRRAVDAETCLVQALRALHDALPAPAGRIVGMTRQAVQQLVDTLPMDVGSGTWTGTSTIPAITAVPWWGHFPAERDSAMLLLGWWAALRGANLAELQWRDVHEIRRGTISVRLRFSKTDQDGVGATLYLPASHANPEMCPVRAVLKWRDTLAARLGVDLTDEGCTQPVFPRLHRAGDVTLDGGRALALSPEAVNDAVVRHAAAAGLPVDGRGALGGHSLRVGFITEALRRGMGVRDVQEVTQHRDVATLLSYQRVVRAVDDNPQARLLGLITDGPVGRAPARSTDQPVPPVGAARSVRIVIPSAERRR